MSFQTQLSFPESATSMAKVLSGLWVQLLPVWQLPAL